MKEFDLINVSLTGSHLLEAGAGTGKTYSLSFLYLRLLLEKHLKVEEIVVVSFTKAATAELKQKIYTLLFKAENILLDISLNHNNNYTLEDNTLYQWLFKLYSDKTKSELYKRLRLAQAQFDRAQIHSINGFALQLLSEHAVTLGQNIPKTILDDNYQLIKNIYLRMAHNNFADLGRYKESVGKAVSKLKSRELFNLLDSMNQHYDDLKKTEKHFPNYEKEQIEFNEIVNDIILDTKGQKNTIKAIDDAIIYGYLDKRSYKIDLLNIQKKNLMDKTAYQFANKKFFEFFSQKKLTNSLTRKGRTLKVTFDYKLCSDFSKLYSLSSSLEKLDKFNFYQQIMVLLGAVRKQLNNEKIKDMALTHDDIMQIVVDGADKLKLSLQALLLDEAQDTNGKQLELFKKLFLHRGHTCFFVGDPKQAIYGFRGGDVYTYLEIHKKVDNHHRLPKNYRSTKAVVKCINKLFAGNPFAETNIDYHAVKWNKTDDKSSFGNKALSLVISEDKNYLAETAAKYIIKLLNAKHWINDGGKKRALCNSDIAILVRTGSQAKKMQDALSKYGIASSYTGKNSVYASNEALLMHSLLAAINSRKIKQIKSLMLTPLFNYNIDDLFNINIINNIYNQFSKYLELNDKHGFTVMFYHFMHQHKVGGRLLTFIDGNRRLSNWMQLFELLQTALQKQSMTLLGLNEWLLQRINENDNEGELRLEDKNAISIVTIHKAKGLEFNVVCLPFFSHYRKRNHGGKELLVSQKEKIAVLKDLNFPKISNKFITEQNNEEIRLAYVALTRAVYHNIIIELPESDKKRYGNSLWARLTQELTPPITYYSFTDKYRIDIKKPPTNKQRPKNHLHLLELTNNLYPKWEITSFSALSQQEKQNLNYYPNLANNDGISKSAPALMQFPTGAKAGIVLHKLYEYYMKNRLCDDNFIAYIDDVIYHSKLAVDVPSKAIALAIANTAKIILSPHDFCLNDIKIENQSIEIPFFIHLSSSYRQYLYKLFAQNIDNNIEGYLHGFIDYCFSYQNQFYILDYKSNKLGEQIKDYHKKAMQEAMIEHHYELQALIYTLALCKHLDINNKDDYQKVIGGYYYLFIRGMTLPVTADKDITNNNQGIYYKRIDWDLLSPLLIDYKTMIT